MRILQLNEKSDPRKDLFGPESEPVNDPKTIPVPESELLDRLAPDWQLRLRDGAVVVHILEVIHRPSRYNRSRASLSSCSRPLRHRVRQQTALLLPDLYIYLSFALGNSRRTPWKRPG
jgi:hypothetical protein